MRKIKNGLILSAGDSTRFWPLEEKSLLPFLGKPLIIHQIEKLKDYCQSITIVANQFNSVKIHRFLENYHLNDEVKVIVQNDLNKGQAGAILSVKKVLSGETIVFNANDILDFSFLKKIVDFSFQENRLIFFGKKINHYFPGGYFEFDENHKIKSIIEKPLPEKIPSPYVKLVMDYFSDIKLLYEAIDSSLVAKDDLYEQALTKLLSRSLKKDFFEYQGVWQSLKYGWDVLGMMKIFLNEIKKRKISEKSIISPRALIYGDVLIEENVKIGDFVKIVGPAYIGKNTVISDYSLIRESQIGEDSLVGSYTEVARSYIGNQVFLHRNYIGDSVIDDQVLIGASALTANLRFDGNEVKSMINDKKINTGFYKLGAIIGKKTKIGVNATILPGIKIGKNSLIAPQEKVFFDVPDKTYLSKGRKLVNKMT